MYNILTLCYFKLTGGKNRGIFRVAFRNKGRKTHFRYFCSIFKFFNHGKF